MSIKLTRRGFARIGAAAGIGALLGGGVAQAAEAVAFGALPAVQDPAISPDGAALAWIANVATGPQLVVQPLNGGPGAAIGLGGIKPRSVIWASPGVVLLSVSTTVEIPRTTPPEKIERLRVIAYNVATKKISVLRTGGEDDFWTSVQISHLARDGSGAVYIPQFEFRATQYRESTGSRLGTDTPANDAYVYSLYRVDPVSGKASVVVRGDKDTTNMLLGPNGQPVMRSDFDGKAKRQDILVRLGGAWKVVVSESRFETSQVALAGLEPGGAAALLFDMRGESYGFKRVDLATGAVSDVAPLGADASIEDRRIDFRTGEVVSVTLSGMAQTARWIDADLAAKQAKLDRAFKGKTVRLYDWSADRAKLVIAVGAPSQPDEFFLFDATANRADPIGSTYPQLASVTFGQKTTISYPARDGVAIPAYLTTPAGKANGLVVLPHGGPQARDDDGFDYWAQHIASLGFAVLQPQFRGSDGFGAAWARAGIQQWGLRMQDDVTDGVRHLLATGQYDAKRVAIVGASYGGYAALAGATLTPDLFACAASYAGVSHLAAMLGYTRRRGGRYSEALLYWQQHIGEDRAELKAVSPALQADKARAPILLIHGKDDTIVPFEQSQFMADALKAAGKPVQMVSLDGEDHWLSGAATRVRMMEEVGRFLTANIGGKST